MSLLLFTYLTCYWNFCFWSQKTFFRCLESLPLKKVNALVISVCFIEPSLTSAVNLCVAGGFVRSPFHVSHVSHNIYWMESPWSVDAGCNLCRQSVNVSSHATRFRNSCRPISIIFPEKVLVLWFCLCAFLNDMLHNFREQGVGFISWAGWWGRSRVPGSDYKAATGWDSVWFAPSTAFCPFGMYSFLPERYVCLLLINCRLASALEYPQLDQACLWKHVEQKFRQSLMDFGWGCSLEHADVLSESYCHHRHGIALLVVCDTTGTKGYQGSALASPNTGPYCFNSRRWLQCVEAIKFRKFACILIINGSELEFM